MSHQRLHFRNTLPGSLFAVIPLAVTAFIIKVEEYTRKVSEYLFGHYVPLVGVLVIAVAIRKVARGYTRKW